MNAIPSYIHIYSPDLNPYSSVSYRRKEGQICIRCDKCQKSWYANTVIRHNTRDVVKSSIIRHWRKFHE